MVIYHIQNPVFLGLSSSSSFGFSLASRVRTSALWLISEGSPASASSCSLKPWASSDLLEHRVSYGVPPSICARGKWPALKRNWPFFTDRDLSWERHLSAQLHVSGEVNGSAWAWSHNEMNQKYLLGGCCPLSCIPEASPKTVTQNVSMPKIPLSVVFSWCPFCKLLSFQLELYTFSLFEIQWFNLLT